MRHRKGRHYQIPNYTDGSMRFPNNDDKFASINPLAIIPTERNKSIQNGFHSLGRPSKPKLARSKQTVARKDHTSVADHWSPLGRHAPAHDYLAGTKRRPGGSTGRGHHRR